MFRCAGPWALIFAIAMGGCASNEGNPATAPMGATGGGSTGGGATAGQPTGGTGAGDVGPLGLDAGGMDAAADEGASTTDGGGADGGTSGDGDTGDDAGSDMGSDPNLDPYDTAVLLDYTRLVDESHTSDGSDHINFAGSLGARSLVHAGHQYVVYYTARDQISQGTRYAQVRVARRNVETFSDWSHASVPGYQLTSEDVHNRQAIAVSEGDGVLHIAFDHHNNRELRYARTPIGAVDNPESTVWDDDLLTYVPNLDLPRLQGQSTTGPSFNAFQGGNLILYMRNGHANGGEMFVARYSASQSEWTDTRLVSSRTGVYETGSAERGPYTAQGMQVDEDGGLHVAWLFREESDCNNGGSGGADCNHGVYYAYSGDEGVTWRGNDGSVVANTDEQERISISNIGSPVVDVPHALRPSNVSNASTFDDVAGEMHVLLRHQTAPDEEMASHHYIRGVDGVWRGGPSNFNAPNAELVFQGDKLFALIGRTDAELYFARRDEDFETWYPIELPSLPGPASDIDGGYTTWDASLLSQGQLIAVWHQPPSSLGAPTPIDVYSFEVGSPSQ